MAQVAPNLPRLPENALAVDLISSPTQTVRWDAAEERFVADPS